MKSSDERDSLGHLPKKVHRRDGTTRFTDLYRVRLEHTNYNGGKPIYMTAYAVDPIDSIQLVEQSIYEEAMENGFPPEYGSVLSVSVKKTICNCETGEEFPFYEEIPIEEYSKYRG